MARRFLGLTVWLLLSCGGEEPARRPVTHVLSDGTVVDVAGDGAWAITTVDGRRTVGLAAGEAPIVRAFDERVTFAFGFFEHRRIGTVEHPTTFRGSVL